MDHSERLTRLSLIIEEFEDLLDERGIELDNDDKRDAIADGEDPEGLATIYGEDYYRLESAIENILIGHGLLEKEE